MDDNLVPDATAGLVAAGVRVPDDLEVVAHANFPYVTPSAVLAKRFGYDIHRIFNTCVNIIEQLRRGEAVPQVTPLPAYLDDELEGATDQKGGG